MKVKKGKAFYLLILALAAYVVKNIMVGADTDEGYGIMVGYRLAVGDKMLLEMWEPHQTSAIFTALFIRPFLWVTGGNLDFLNIYLRIAYFVVHAAITVCAYKTFSVCTPGVGQKGALGFSLLFFVCSPKSIFVPEYSNMHIWFFSLVCFCFMWYYCEESPLRRKKWVLVAAGIALACDVLAYPSMVILFPFCVGFIWCKRDKKLAAEIIAFVAPCVSGAVALMGYILSYMSPEQVLEVIPHILGDGSHQTTLGDKMTQYLGNFAYMAIILLVCSLVALLLAKVYIHVRKRKGHEEDFVCTFLVLFFVTQIVYMLYTLLTHVYNAGYPRLIYVAIILAGICCYRKSGKTEKVGFCLICFAAVNYIGVLLLSNWMPELLNIYLLMGAIGGFLCWKAYFEAKQHKLKDCVIQTMSLILVFVCIFGYCFRIIGGELTPSTLFEIRGYNHEGFRKWILTSYMTAYRYNNNMEIWPEAVPDGSTVMYVGMSQFSYMQGDCVVAVPSTISTPTYDETLLAYWEMNPDRYPDVVVIESCYGDIGSIAEDEFLMDWLEQEFQAKEITDYPYMRVYRR